MFTCASFPLPIHCLSWICEKAPEEGINSTLAHVIKGHWVVIVRLERDWVKGSVIWGRTMSTVFVPYHTVAESESRCGKAVNG